MPRVRTGYSFHTAAGTLEDVISRLVEVGSTRAPITDRTSTFAFTEWQKLCNDNNISPLFGVELAVSVAFGVPKPVQDCWCFLAINELISINQLVHTATANPCSTRYDPSLSYQQSLNAKDVVVIAGERLQVGLLPEILPEHFYMALSPATPKGLLKEATARGVKLIASSDNYYPRENDLEFYRVALGRRAGTQTYPLHILSDEEWVRSVDWFASSSDIESALVHRNDAFALCKAKLLKAELFAPEVKLSLRQMCVAGAKFKNVNLKDVIYKERLDRELRLIDEKKYEDYFFIIADLIQYAKKHMMVGPARGCFLPDQNVIEKGGKYTPIQDIKVDSFVKDAFGKYQKVIDKFEYQIDEEIIEIEFHDGEKLHCTKDHEILVKNKWIKAEDLKIGQLVNSHAKSFIRSNESKHKMRLRKLINNGWPKRIALKALDNIPLSISEGKLVPQKSKYYVLIHCLGCDEDKKVQIRKIANRDYNLAWKPICNLCINKISPNTKEARAKNSKAQSKIQGKLKQRIKNAFSVSNSKNGRANKYDLLFKFPGYRKEIIKRDKGICQHPECENIHSKIDTHHIDYGSNSNPFNMITLCTGCHSRHHNYFRYQKDRAAKEQKLFLRLSKRNTNAQGQKSKVKTISELFRKGL